MKLTIDEAHERTLHTDVLLGKRLFCTNHNFVSFHKHRLRNSYHGLLLTVFVVWVKLTSRSFSRCLILLFLAFLSLGLLKKALRERPDLKLIITSATLDIKKFADYFDAPMVKIPGKMFPVQIKFLPEKVFCPNSGRIVPAIPLAARTKKTDLFVDASFILTLLSVFLCLKKKTYRFFNSLPLPLCQIMAHASY